MLYKTANVAKNITCSLRPGTIKVFNRKDWQDSLLNNWETATLSFNANYSYSEWNWSSLSIFISCIAPIKPPIPTTSKTYEQKKTKSETLNCMSPQRTKCIFPSLRIKPLFQTFIQFSSEKFIDITILAKWQNQTTQSQFLSRKCLAQAFFKKQIKSCSTGITNKLLAEQQLICM